MKAVDLADLARQRARRRFLYVLPNFQNPTGRTMTEARRQALVQRRARTRAALVEDNPYGDLWFEQPAAAAAGGA
jgi:2-aminoadipate transaminase